MALWHPDRYGSTAAYAAVAAVAGNQKAVLAVGTACARNPLPVVVPHTQALSDARRRVDTINDRMNQATGIAPPTTGEASLSAARGAEQALAATRTPFKATPTHRPDSLSPGR